jgi:hypothetical protein
LLITDLDLENLAVRTYPHEPQGLIVWLFVDEKQVWFEVALAMVGIFAGQRMIVESFRQRRICRQERNGGK